MTNEKQIEPEMRKLLKAMVVISETHEKEFMDYCLEIGLVKEWNEHTSEQLNEMQASLLNTQDMCVKK